MADNDKLEINFRDLARSATQYVFSSTFPSLERMLKTVKTTGEENKAQVENLNVTIESINTKLGDINTGLRKLNDTMAKSLGILGKILKNQDTSSSGSGDGSLLPKTGLGNITKAAGATLGAGAMFSIIENQQSAPPAPTAGEQESGAESKAMPAASVASTGGASAPAAQPAASKAGSSAGGGSPTAPPKPEEKSQAAGGGKSLVIKASTISFEAGQIIFGGGASAGTSMGSSSGGGSTAATSAPPAQQQSGGGASAAPQQASTGGGQFSPSESVTGDNGRLNTSQLTRIPGGLLQASAAQPYIAMVNAAKEENISWGVSDSYRDYPTQVRLAREKGLYSQGGLAATPGRSNHGWGTALDLDFKQHPKAHAWLTQNAGRFGFKTIPREAWHWEYKGGGSGGGTMVAKGGDQSKIGGEGAAGGGGPQTSSDGGGEKPKTGPSASLGASPAMPPAPKPEEKKTASAAPVAAAPSKGAALNKESTNSEVSSVTPPARASMNNIMAGGGSGGSQSDSLPNPKLANSNKAGNVEPEDATQRYESLFGIKPKVPTGNSAKVA